MYENLLKNSLSIVEGLTTPIPEKGRIAGLGVCTPGNGRLISAGDNVHFPMGTAYLTLGVRGVARKAEKSAKEKSGEEKELLEGVSRVYDAIGDYFERFSFVLLKENEPRLKKIGENLKHLSQDPPETFEQALQLFALVWVIRNLNRAGGTLGRLDVQLNPFYEKDLERGELNEEDAIQILSDFWKLIDEKQSGDTLNNVMVGGKNPDGTVAGGRLSALIIKSKRLTVGSEPHINVRVHEGMRADVRAEMISLQALGHGQGTMYNDEVIIPGMLRSGIPEEIAYAYANDGCTEVVLEGNAGIDFYHIDAVATFELAFNNGSWAKRNYREKVKYWKDDQVAKYYTPDAIAGFESGRIEDCETFDEFYSFFLKQYKFQLMHKCQKLLRLHEDRLAGGETSLLLNGSFDNILDSGKDVFRGGFPCNWYMMFSGSIPTVADCLVSIKKLIFEKKSYTVSQVKEAIYRNFEGFEDMRQEMLSQPKFGNDLDEVDLIASDIAEKFCLWLEEFSKKSQFPIYPALLGWRFLEEAYGIAATPDGRKYGDPIAEHFCATPGKAVKGPTAHIASIAKAKKALEKAIGVGAVHITLPANLGKDEQEKKMLLSAIGQAALKGGLNQLNIALYDVELLRRAQKDPENHRDVIVRVWGYSARFVDLCREMQEHVIGRVAK